VQNVPPKPTHRAAKISNPTQWDFKYPTNFGFWKKCQLPSNLESITSLGLTFLKSVRWMLNIIVKSLFCSVRFLHFGWYRQLCV